MNVVDFPPVGTDRVGTDSVGTDSVETDRGGTDHDRSPDGRSAAHGPGRGRDAGRPPEPPEDGDRCSHRIVSLDSIRAEWCLEDGSVRWWEHDHEISGESAVGRLFGGFDLVGRLPSLHGPAEDAVVAVPADRAGRRTLADWPHHRWLEAAPGLWLCGTETHLLVAPLDPALRVSFGRRISDR